METNAVTISVDLIDPNPKQPRRTFDQKALEELAGTIKVLGVIQPIVVEAAGDRYFLHDGERRLRATRLAGLETIPAVVVSANGAEITDKERLIRAVVANEQRQQLTPVEVARSYQQLHEQGMNDSQIAAAMGKSREKIANARRLLKLPDLHLRSLENGELSERQAMALLPLFSLPDGVRQALSTWVDIQNFLESPFVTAKWPSDRIRERIDQAHYELSRPFKGEFPQETPIAGTQGCKIVQPLCAGCPYLYNKRCYYSSCYMQKIYFWRQAQLVPVDQALTTGRWQFMERGGNFTCISCGRAYSIGWGTSSNPDHYPRWYDADSIYPTTEENRDKAGGFQRNICTNCHPAPPSPPKSELPKQSSEPVATRMFGHWSCGRCNRNFPPGTRYNVPEYSKGICEECLEELQNPTSNKKQQAIDAVAQALAVTPLPVLKMIGFEWRDFDLLQAEETLTETDAQTLAGKIATTYINKRVSTKEREKLLRHLGFAVSARTE